jgi:hypothetical protein
MDAGIPVTGLGIARAAARSTSISRSAGIADALKMALI